MNKTYKVNETTELLDVHLQLGGWVHTKRRWQFVTSHEYQVHVLATLTLFELVEIIAPLIAATGRSDGQGRGPGIVLTPEQSNVIDTLDGAHQMIRLCYSDKDTPSVHSSATSLPYHKIAMVPRHDKSQELRDFMTEHGGNKVSMQSFLDVESPDAAMDNGTTLCRCCF